MSRHFRENKIQEQRMFAKTKEKARKRTENLKRFLRNIEFPFPDPNLGRFFGYASNVTGSEIRITFLGGLVKSSFKYNNIESARREIYKGGAVSWRLMRWGKCPRDAQGIRIRLRMGLFRNHLIIFPDLTRAEQELKYRKVLFK